MVCRRHKVWRAQNSEGNKMHTALVSKVQSICGSISRRNKIIQLRLQKKKIAQVSNVTNCNSLCFCSSNFRSKKVYANQVSEGSSLYIAQNSQGKNPAQVQTLKNAPSRLLYKEKSDTAQVPEGRNLYYSNLRRKTFYSSSLKKSCTCIQT